jgi:hypothetical protein
VWSEIDKSYGELKDSYPGQINWQIVDTDTLEIARENMAGGLWYAYAESPSAFGQWLRLFGWKKPKI